MIFLALYWSFLKIGFTSFGGFSMIPLINSEMTSRGWMTPEEVSDIVAIAEMTPGPLALNCASFAGMRTAGPLGAIISNLGILTPTFTIVLIAAVFFTKFKESHFVKSMMVGIRPACIGMISGVAITLSQSNYSGSHGVNLFAVGIGVIDLILVRKWKLSVPKLILCSAVFGLLFFGVLGLY